jgi:hypothetical protein
MDPHVIALIRNHPVLAKSSAITTLVAGPAFVIITVAASPEISGSRSTPAALLLLLPLAGLFLIGWRRPRLVGEFALALTALLFLPQIAGSSWRTGVFYEQLVLWTPPTAASTVLILVGRSRGEAGAWAALRGDLSDLSDSLPRGVPVPLAVLVVGFLLFVMLLCILTVLLEGIGSW